MKKLVLTVFFVVICFNLLAQSRTIKVGLDNNYPPYEYVDKHGEIKGFNVHLLKEIEPYTPYKFEFYADSWANIVRRYNAGEIDILSGMFLSEERAKNNYFSIPHNLVSYVIFYQKDKPQIDISKLSDKKLLVQKDDIINMFMIENSYTNVIEVQDPEEAILRLRFNEYDGAVISLVAGNYFISKHQIDDIIFNPKELMKLSYCFASKYKNKDIIDEINEKFYFLITSGKYHKIQENWFSFNKKINSNIIGIILALIIISILFLIVWCCFAYKKVKNKTKELESEKKESNKLKSTLDKNIEIYEKLVTVLNEGIWEWDLITKLTNFSKTYCNMLGYKQNELSPTFQTWKDLLHPDDRQIVIKKIYDSLYSGEKTFEISFRLRKKDKSYIWVLSRGIVTKYNENNEPVYLIGIHSDISSQRKLEEQLYQTQKMDALGKLSGVIAHDFNNLITSILGNTDLAMNRSEDKREIMDRLTIIRDVCSKAKQLTKKMLMMSKRQENHPTKTDIVSSIEENISIIKRLLGEDIIIEYKTIKEHFEVYIDIELFEQAFLNICVNAKEAMLKGGKLTISIDKVFLDSAFITYHSNLSAGDYIQITFEDTGIGMNSNTQKRIFEPFFSTKQTSSGLGLTIVYNIISQANGEVSVYSEQGIGTVFKVYLPLYAQQEILSENSEFNTQSIQTSKDKFVVIIEDDSEILKMIQEVLEKEGFSVKSFLSGNAFLNYISANFIPISFMLIDIILPDIRGYRIKELLPEQYLDVAVIYMSGYPKDMILKEFNKIRYEHLILKPFSSSELLEKIKSIIHY
ncbi:MAG: transporter substrate-binding domain-containing protein [Candidatus Cloacimonetes bacterium]|nr:transporter substrate-binding domain-containing protein [Candidatus Cloacimonadota bacterium]